MTDHLTHAAFIDTVKFDDKGLVPVIAQSKETGEVLMFAWMTRHTLEMTLATGRVTYWSRSRQSV
jgi:phosphoribosyl-AMP cyclohydrolase